MSLLNPEAGSSAPNPKVSSENDQFHHFVPRFILKKFSQQQKSKKVQHRGRGKKAASAAIQDPIYSYSIPTGTLATTPISTSYGVKNLYKDIKNQQNIHHIEQKLSVLEGHASKSIAGLHKLVESRASEENKGRGPAEPVVFRIQRKYLNYLRKFMFIMYYRKEGYQKLHFQEDHPENLAGAEWIRNFRKKKNLDASEVWLYVLEQYLDTPHTELVDKGRMASEKIRGVIPSLSHPLDPNLEHYEMVGYHGEATNFFLAIWEAAEGEEFVITDNSFGLVEGVHSPKIPTMFPFHRFYVVSPRIALVLCSVCLRPDFPRGHMPMLEEMFERSMLVGAPHKAAKVTNDNGDMVYRDGRVETYEEDIMEFEVTRLSMEHTHKVNAIILGNVRNTGTVTFHTPLAILRTLESFSKDGDFANQRLYEPLVQELLKRDGRSSQFSMNSGPSSPPPRRPLFDPNWEENSGEDQDPPDFEAVAPGFWESTLVIHSKLKENSNELAIQVYKREEDKVILEAAAKIAQTPHDLTPRPAQLRRNMDGSRVVAIFTLLKGFITRFLEIELPRLFTEVVVIAFLEWLLKNRRLMFLIIERKIGVQLKEYQCSPFQGTKVSRC